MLLVPYEKLSKVNSLLEMCRENYDKRLAYGAERLKEIILDMGLAQPVKKNDLVEGKSYGYIGYSIGATAIRDGKQLRNHGEIYIYKYTWTGNEFTAVNAWGVRNYKQMLAEPIIELS